MDKYQEMRVFTAVVDAGSFVAAGDALNLSKAAVSRHVSALEKRLGVRLMHRTTRKLSLTPEGELFLMRCRDVLAGIDAAEAELSTRSVTASGELKISVPVSFGIGYLAPIWRDFVVAQPQVTLDVQLTDRVIDLVEEGLDLAVRIGRLPDSTLVSKQLSSTRLVLCAAPDYLKRRGMPVHPSQLIQHDTVAYSLLSTGDQWQFEGPDGPFSVKVRPCMRSNNGDTCVAASISGAGIALQPTFLVHDALKNGALVEVLPEFRAAKLGIYAIYPSRKFVLPKLRAIVEFLSARLKDAPWKGL